MLTSTLNKVFREAAAKSTLPDKVLGEGRHSHTERSCYLVTRAIWAGTLLLVLSGATQAAELRIDEDKWLRINGEVVIPFGYYFGGREHESAMDGGANMTVLWSGLLDEVGRQRFYQEARGLPPHIVDAVPMQQAPAHREPLDTNTLDDIVEQLSDQPALLGYYLADEPELGHGTPAQVAALDAYLKAKDPGHITVISNAFGGHELWAEKNQRYFDCADVIAFEVYSGGGGSRIINTLDWAVPLLAKRRAASWAIIWTGMRAPSGNHANTPTQVRNHSYLALLHGARGLLYFKQNDASRSMPDTYPEEMEQLSAEIKLLTPWLANNHPVEQVTAQPEAIHARSYECRGETVIVAVNTADRTLRAALDIPQQPERIEVLWEGRVLTPTAQGWFDEVFEPWGVHLYRFPPGEPPSSVSLPPPAAAGEGICYVATYPPEQIPASVGQLWRQAADQWRIPLQIGSMAILDDLEQARSYRGMLYEGLIMSDLQARNAEKFVRGGGRFAVVGVANKALAYDVNLNFQFDNRTDYWGYVDYSDDGLSLGKYWCILPRVARCLVSGRIELGQIRVVRQSALTAGLPVGEWIDLQSTSTEGPRLAGKLSLITSVLGRTLRRQVLLEGRSKPTEADPEPQAVPIAALNQYGWGQGIWLAIEKLPTAEGPVLQRLIRNLLTFLAEEETTEENETTDERLGANIRDSGH